nr:hypothetical protein GCM10010200_047830 [Actinomadura rugatobispora]
MKHGFGGTLAVEPEARFGFACQKEQCEVAGRVGGGLGGAPPADRGAVVAQSCQHVGVQDRQGGFDPL